MALPINITDLINRRVVENARVEYKRNWNPETILHSICAFANDIDNWGGGYIIIGIEEENGMPKLPVEGLEKSSIDRINKELLQKCNLIEPRYIPVVEQTTFAGADIIVLWIPGRMPAPTSVQLRFQQKNPQRRKRRTISASSPTQSVQTSLKKRNCSCLQTMFPSMTAPT